MPTNVEIALPDLDLAPGSTIEVSTGDASAVITKLNVYTVSDTGGTPAEVLPPLFGYLAPAANGG